mmetsp:Transcript_12393/g.19342  ORF Transcript_12393/g.19342 Transcript_12393/m.19342 type:complete len:85 (-) Transcript_12393:554-808(-)
MVLLLELFDVGHGLLLLLICLPVEEKRALLLAADDVSMCKRFNVLGHLLQVLALGLLARFLLESIFLLLFFFNLVLLLLAICGF